MVKTNGPRQTLIDLLTRQGRGKTRQMRRGVTAEEVRAAIEVVSWWYPDLDWDDERATAEACRGAVCRAAEIKVEPPADSRLDIDDPDYAWDLVAVYCRLSGGWRSRHDTLAALGISPYDPTKFLLGVPNRWNPLSGTSKRRRPWRPPTDPIRLAKILERCERCKRLDISLFQCGFGSECRLKNVKGSGCYGGLLAGRIPPQPGPD
jgi:hypothetical protein